MILSGLLLALGFALVLAGVAALSIPAALIVAGLALAGLALLVDFDTWRKGGNA